MKPALSVWLSGRLETGGNALDLPYILLHFLLAAC